MALNIEDVGRESQCTQLIRQCHLHGKEMEKLFDVEIDNGSITNIQESRKLRGAPKEANGVINAAGRLLMPSLCHAHVHLDKSFILQDEAFEDYLIETGDFDEAMKITGEAKARFNRENLLRRGRRLIEESVAAGVTAMRVFVEVDEIVKLQTLEAAIALKSTYEQTCYIQICAFAQLPLFVSGGHGDLRRRLLTEASRKPEVEAIGSTPYVESERDTSEGNVRWVIQQALQQRKHVDFHLDYNISIAESHTVGFVLKQLMQCNWTRTSKDRPEPLRNVTLGHCNRLIKFSDEGWDGLTKYILRNQFPVSFVGLPTSDLYMMGRPDPGFPLTEDRPRGTLQVPQVIYQGLNCAMSVNNVGNAFTPHGSCDPLHLASMGMLVYQAATTRDCEVLFAANSTRAKAAIGLSSDDAHETQGLQQLRVGDAADLVLLGDPDYGRQPTSAADCIYDTEPSRTVLYKGRVVAERRTVAQIIKT